MGRPFLEHFGGKKFYVCAGCKTYLASKKQIVSTTFRGATGQAYLFRSVVNVVYSALECRNMITGAHMVRDVSCKCCDAKLGWMYEFAVESNQTYKEGHTILERKLLEEVEVSGQLAKTDKERPPMRSNRISSLVAATTVNISGISGISIGSTAGSFGFRLNSTSSVSSDDSEDSSVTVT